MIAKYKAKNYRVHSRKKETTIQLLGGRCIRIKTVYMLPVSNRKPGRKRGVGRRGPQGKGIYPVLKMLGIAHSATPSLQNEATLSALNNTFAEARDNLQRHGIAVSSKRVRTISENVAATAIEKRQAEIEQFNNGTLPQGNTFAGQDVVISIDGGRVHIRQSKKGKRKKGQKRNGFRTVWIEPKIFTIYAIDENGVQKNKQVVPCCDGTVMGLEKFKILFLLALHKTGVSLAKSITFVCDGAPWIWKLIDEAITETGLDRSKIHEILDFYHAAEHLWAVIDALPGLTPDQKKRLFKKHRQQLKQGQITVLIERLGKRAKGHSQAHKELRYFLGHEARCQYGDFLLHKLPIGSGAVESAIRRIINLRLKGAGMFWLQNNAESFLHLRCQLKTGQWKNFFSNIVAPN